jgi:hypothetical protein
MLVIDPSTHVWLPEDMSKYCKKAMNDAIVGEPRQRYSSAAFGQGNKDGGTKQHKANRLESLLRWKNLARIYKATLPSHMEKHHIIFLTSFDDMQVAKCTAKEQIGFKHMCILTGFARANDNTIFVKWFNEQWTKHASYLIASA